MDLDDVGSARVNASTGDERVINVSATGASQVSFSTAIANAPALVGLDMSSSFRDNGTTPPQLGIGTKRALLFNRVANPAWGGSDYFNCSVCPWNLDPDFSFWGVFVGSVGYKAGMFLSQIKNTGESFEVFRSDGSVRSAAVHKGLGSENIVPISKFEVGDGYTPAVWGVNRANTQFMRSYYNGELSDEVAGSSATIGYSITSNSQFLFGLTAPIGASTPTDYGNTHGRVGEVLGFRRALSQVEVDKMQGYLCWKWGARTSGTSPYALRPPMISD
jgi:hypothetical protein